MAGSHERIDLLLSFRVVILGHSSDTDFLVKSGFRFFFVIEHFFVELFAVAQACILNFHALRSAQFDHTFSHVGNAHRFAHIKDENFSTLTMCARFEYQLAGFWDEHKEANDVWMSHCDGASSLNLAAEERNDRTVRAQDVAEARRYELRLSLYYAVLFSMVEALHINLADAFGAPHDVCRVHSLVCRYHNKLLYPVFYGHICNDACAFDVVLNSF